MKLTIISDTHSQQSKLRPMSGDVLIHCGDMFNLYSEDEHDIERMDTWFAEQDFELILCIGGNHDLSLEQRLRTHSQPFRNAKFLHGESYQYQGVNFFGASFVPDLQGQAFYAEDKALKKEWAVIPKSTDVLITHTPPFGVLDKSSQGMVLGCKYLAKRVKQVKPQVHCFGHVHASSGVETSKHTTFVNAALAGRGHQLVREPYTIQL